MAEEYGISKNIHAQFILKSPSQNYALINYLINFNKNLLINLQYQKQDLLSFIKK